MIVSRGRRSIMEQEHLVDVRAWARHFKVPVPAVQVRSRRAGQYRGDRQRISLPPHAHRDSLVHEFAHHLDHVVYSGRRHGPTFRVALLQVAAVAYGRAEDYNWAREYRSIVRWAERHGLLAKSIGRALRLQRDQQKGG